MGRKLKYLIAALCVAVILTGCSSAPSASKGEQAIQDRISQESEGRIRLTEFQKTNGQQGEVMGVKVYGLEFDAQIEFTEDCKWITGMFGQQLSFRTSKAVAQKQSGFTWDKFRDAADNPGSIVSKGQDIKVSGVVRFVKKEKGWTVDGIELTQVTPISLVSGDASARPSQRTWKRIAAKTQISSFSVVLESFEIDNQYFPKGKNALLDLVQRPSGAANWHGPYLREISKDPWGNDYIYESPGKHNPKSYDLMSMGPDGRAGGDDDITNW